jgi:hypothetical protein
VDDFGWYHIPCLFAALWVTVRKPWQSLQRLTWSSCSRTKPSLMLLPAPHWQTYIPSRSKALALRIRMPFWSSQPSGCICFDRRSYWYSDSTP